MPKNQRSPILRARGRALQGRNDTELRARRFRRWNPLWWGAGLLLPAILAAATPAQVVNETTPLALILAIFATAFNYVEFELSIGGTGPKFSPVGAPIVLAAITCTPTQAIYVAVLAYLLDLRTARRSIRSALQAAGLASIATAATAGLLGIANFGTAEYLGTLTVATIATSAYLLLDAAGYAAWFQLESGSGRDVVDYYRRAAPLDITLTATAVIIAAPLAERPVALAVILLVYQVVLYLLYRLSSSEARHKEQSSYLKDVFSRYVPESVAERLSDRASDIRLGGETREVSILFCDIRGFTSWSEQHDAETVVRELNAVLGDLTEAVMRYEGTLDKFTGDGLMAFWGAPLDQPNHAELACRAAVAIHEALVRCNAARQAAGMPAFRIGVGISSGPAVVGNVGHEKRLEYTAIGDTVNLSARLEAATKELGIPTAIGESTWVALPETARLMCTTCGEVRVKGKAMPVQVYGLPSTAFAEPAQELDLGLPGSPIDENQAA